jgi:CheY-like chemotaxis protein
MTPRALVVDDAADVRLLVKQVCLMIGVEADEASSGRDALEQLSAGALPDLVVLDVQMPELDGWDTLAAIRSDARTHTLPVVLCSVRSQPADVDRASQLGANEFVSKPFGVDELASVVRRVVEEAP